MKPSNRTGPLCKYEEKCVIKKKEFSLSAYKIKVKSTLEFYCCTFILYFLFPYYKIFFE